MGNFILFINSFLSYLLIFAIAAVLLVVGCTIGIRWRKSKDAKHAAEEKAADQIDAMPAE